MSMMLSLGLAAVIDLCKNIMKVGGIRRSSNIITADSSSAPIFRDIQEEILIEILVRLPADSLSRFKCVSRHLCSLISSRYFTNLFFKFSSSRCRVFMTVVDMRRPLRNNDFMLFSSSLSNLDTTTSFLELDLDLTMSGIKNPVHFVSVLRGLMCFREERAIRIINLTTRQVLNLPLVKSNMLESCFFGYDSVNDEYKVLITICSHTEKEWRVSDTQVLVLGVGASWRNTRSHISPPPHCPYTEGISINNVLYYGALTHEERLALMSFDLNYEEFNQIEIPVGCHTVWRRRDSQLNLIDKLINYQGQDSQLNLINYQGQVTLVDDFRLNTECILDLWMIEDAGKNKWSHKVFVLPCHQLKLSLRTLKVLIRGTNRSGEVMLSGRYDINKKPGHAIYDLETNRITREVIIESIYWRFPNYWVSRFSMYSMTNLWEDVENIMYLEA